MKAVALVITKLASGPLVTGQSAVLCPVQMRHMNNSYTVATTKTSAQYSTEHTRSPTGTETDQSIAWVRAMHGLGHVAEVAVSV